MTRFRKESSYPPRVSFIVVTMDMPSLLSACVESIVKTNYPNQEIIIVDNGNGGGSKSFQKEFDCKVILNMRNVGFAEGINIGFRASTGSYLLLLNDDIVLEPGCVKELVRVMEDDVSIGVAGCKLLSIDGKRIQYAGSFINERGYKILRGWNEEDRGQYDDVLDVDSAPGGAMMVRREVFNKVGQFDSTFFAYYEDDDFCLRVRKAGYRVVFVPGAVIRHHMSATMKGRKKFVVLNSRNRVRFILKHFSKRAIARWLTLEITEPNLRVSPFLLIGFLWSLPRFIRKVLD